MAPGSPEGQTLHVINETSLSHPAILFVLFLVTIWSGVWKGIALWHAGRNAHLAWFVVLCILNVVGILDIIYIFAVGRPALKAKRARGE